MTWPVPSSRVALTALAVVVTACVGDSKATRFRAFDAERAAREAAVASHLAAYEEDFRAFLYQPVGNFGVPLETILAMPHVMPDLVGPESERWARVGLGRDLFDPDNPLPLGLGTFDQNGVTMVNLTCAGCHVGRVIGRDGREHALVGAPNTRFASVFTVFEDAAADPRWDELGGGVEAAAARAALLVRRQIEERTIGGFTFDPARVAQAPDYFSREQRGYFDSFATIFALQTLPDTFFTGSDAVVASVMPPLPGEADVMSMYMQSARPRNEWDGSLPDPVYRNLAASVGAIGFGTLANLDVARRAARLAANLPAPPYPFDVDTARAARGADSFARHCAGCHHDGADVVFPSSLVGTDPNRANSVTEEGRTRLLATLRRACTDPAACDVPDERVVSSPGYEPTRGYLALPLHGIWSRAPYLHNGSVPTLRHLLVPESRPSEFSRGSIHYDEQNVGFAWEIGVADDPFVAPFDTSRAGRSNTGHDDPAFNGLDWAAHPDELEDLLEYLKTL